MHLLAAFMTTLDEGDTEQEVGQPLTKSYETSPDRLFETRLTTIGVQLCSTAKYYKQGCMHGAL